MAPRASWKGFLKISELALPVALYAGATTSARVSFHILNRKTGNRVHRQYFDEETDEAVEPEQQVKGYDTGDNQFIILEPEEIAQTVPESDKTIRIEAFVPLDKVDAVYFDRPYYLAPSGAVATDSFAVIREGMRRKKVAALARAVLFRRVRTLLLRPEGPGLAANTLNFDYQVRSPAKAFADIPKIEIEGEMLNLAEHIIDTKLGDFDPTTFDDRYDAALAELVQAKLEGRPPPRRKEAPREKVVDLMAALRESAKAAKGRKAPAKEKAPRRKAS